MLTGSRYLFVYCISLFNRDAMKTRFTFLNILFFLVFIMPAASLRAQNNPVAVNDSVMYISFSNMVVDVMANDQNPRGKPMEIWQFFVESPGYGPVAKTADGKLRIHDTVFNRNDYRWIISYRIRYTDDTTLFSNWAKVVVNTRMDSAVFCAGAFQAQATAGIPVVIKVSSHIWNPHPSDSVYLRSVNSNRATAIEILSDSVFEFTPSPFYGGIDTLVYVLYSKQGKVPRSDNQITVSIPDIQWANLDINNVEARINARCNQFWNPKEGHTGFYVPKGSQKSPVYCAAFWIGGKDPKDSLCLAAALYGQGPSINPAGSNFDFWPGPVSDSTAYGNSYDSLWNRVWKIEGWQIEYHKHHWMDPGYTPPESFLTWPAHGNPALGQQSLLAPFYDMNGDNIYNPFDGDYPKIDDRDRHTETWGKKLRTEIHVWAYEFNMPADTAFNNSVFFHLEVFNRSTQAYHNTYLGWWTDFDLGYAYDDYVGCDVQRGMGYVYNGMDIDGNGQPEAYGSHPPAEGLTILGGPLKDADGIDNPKKDQFGHQLCNESVNGINFGNGIVDDERFGMTGFRYFNNSGVPPYMTDPHYAIQYYDYLSGLWLDGTHIIYGGNGNPSTGGYGPDCSFMFPGLSDTLNWGTGCVPPNGPEEWTETTAGNKPGDRRGLSGSGPFTFKPGDEEEFDFVYTWARDYNETNPQGSVGKLGIEVDTIRNSFERNRLPNGNQFFGINNSQGQTDMSVKVFPNPAANQFSLRLSSDPPPNTLLNIVNSQGLEVISARPITAKLTTADVSGLPQGLYLIRIRSGAKYITAKLLIIR